MGVKAQFGIKKTTDGDYTWYDANVNNATNDDFGNNDEYTYAYTFLEAGEFEYTFRFSADNGQTWTTAENKGTASVAAVSKVQIPNGDFSQWEDDTTPTGWVIKTGSTVHKAGTDSNPALQITRASSGSNTYAFDSPNFTTTADTPLPSSITFQILTDGTSKVSINLNCGGTQKFYNWNSTSETFVNAANNTYNVVNETSMKKVTIVFGTEIDADYWQGKTCKLEFKYGKNAAYDVTVDDFQIVYPED